MEWRDISTAPKDGRMLLLGLDTGEMIFGRWYAAHSPSHPWVVQGGSEALSTGMVTHWIPMDDFPTVPGAGQITVRVWP